MSVIIKGFDKPEECLGCPFLSKLTEAPVGSEGLYKKIGYCKFASAIMPDLEDPWHDTEWLYTHTEEWCPITQIDENATPCSLSNDCISREALRKALDELFKNGGYDSGLVMDAIDNAPAVEPERPQGQWVYRTDIAFHTCSKCNGIGYIRDRFCKHCGAAMQNAERDAE